MPETAKGEKIMRAMEKTYGPKEGKSVFYASRNKGTISGVDNASSRQQHDYLDCAARGDAAGMRRACDAMTRGRR